MSKLQDGFLQMIVEVQHLQQKMTDFMRLWCNGPPTQLPKAANALCQPEVRTVGQGDGTQGAAGGSTESRGSAGEESPRATPPRLAATAVATAKSAESTPAAPTLASPVVFKPKLETVRDKV